MCVAKVDEAVSRGRHGSVRRVTTTRGPRERSVRGLLLCGAATSWLLQSSSGWSTLAALLPACLATRCLCGAGVPGVAVCSKPKLNFEWLNINGDFSLQYMDCDVLPKIKCISHNCAELFSDVDSLCIFGRMKFV